MYAMHRANPIHKPQMQKTMRLAPDLNLPSLGSRCQTRMLPLPPQQSFPA